MRAAPRVRSANSGPVKEVGYHELMGTHSNYKSILAAAMLLICCCRANPARAQMPFYTDDPSITPIKTIHIEIFDEYDGLQSSQFPDLRQNTANFKFNFSPLSHLE